MYSKIFQCILLLLCVLFNQVKGQENQWMHPGEILSGIKKLDKLGSVLYIAAHPDDENTRVLSWLSKDQQLRTAYLSLTRGEGGQNLIGGEQGDMLGLIRTHELLGARKIDGAQQFFTRALDFGYSKNPEETLQKWNRDSVLSDVVRVIRYFKPDVIICRFPPTGEGGHGHHTASAILALEAFDAAADSRRFPAQVSELGIWQVKKIFWNTFQFGNNNTTAPDQIKLNVGVPLPLLGKSSGEIAAASRSMHKSQGFGTAGVAGEIIEYFKLLKGDGTSDDLFSGLDFSWGRLEGSEDIRKIIRECIREFNPAAPEKSAEILGRIHKLLSIKKPENPESAMWLRVKTAEVEQLLLAVCGLRIEALADQKIMVPGHARKLNLRLINRSAHQVWVEQIRFPDKDSTTNLELPFNRQTEISHPFRPDQQTPYTVPYWLQQPARENLYVLRHIEDLYDHAAEKKMHCELKLRLAGTSFQVKVPLQFKTADPVKGELIQDVELLPPATVSFAEPIYLLTRGDTATLVVTVEAHIAAFKSKLRIRSASRPGISPTFADVEIPQAGQRISYTFRIVSQDRMFQENLIAELLSESGQWEEAICLRRATYDHLPPLLTLGPSVTRLVKFEGRSKVQRIGYIPGSGDEIPGILKQLGYQVNIIPAENLGTVDLSGFQAIITGVRAYNISEEPGIHHEKLMQYVQQGGNLLVQYNTNSRVGPLKSKIGPYNFEISRNRVTDENAPVQFLVPSHVVLNDPYVLGPSDFEGWVQERGIYFAEACAPEYVKPLAFNDPGESPLDGSLIVAPHGKGHFVYTGLSFFRQLPAGVPGATRLFINLLSIPPKQ